LNEVEFISFNLGQVFRRAKSQDVALTCQLVGPIAHFRAGGRRVGATEPVWTRQ